MFGINMSITHNGITVFLRPLTKSDLPVLVEHFSSMKIHLYTQGLYSQTLENEEEWFDNKRKSEDDCVWAIQPAESQVPIGVTALHHLTSSLYNTCSSGIVIWDDKWWGRGVASATHLGRTLFAADFLNRLTINSQVRVPNVASRKALERIGYTIWGEEPVSSLRHGEWLDTYHLKWFHPTKSVVFYPHGIPSFLQDGIAKAKTALDLARFEVQFP